MLFLGIAAVPAAEQADPRALFSPAAAGLRLSYFEPDGVPVKAAAVTSVAEEREYPGAASFSDAGSVRAIQYGLNRLGYEAGPVDGVSGPMTRDAIAAYEQDRGMPESGVPSEALFRRLEAEVPARSSAASGVSAGKAAESVTGPAAPAPSEGTVERRELPSSNAGCAGRAVSLPGGQTVDAGHPCGADRETAMPADGADGRDLKAAVIEFLHVVDALAGHAARLVVRPFRSEEPRWRPEQGAVASAAAGAG